LPPISQKVSGSIPDLGNFAYKPKEISFELVITQEADPSITLLAIICQMELKLLVV